MSTAVNHRSNHAHPQLLGPRVEQEVLEMVLGAGCHGDISSTFDHSGEILNLSEERVKYGFPDASVDWQVATGVPAPAAALLLLRLFEALQIPALLVGLNKNLQPYILRGAERCVLTASALIKKRHAGSKGRREPGPLQDSPHPPYLPAKNHNSPPRVSGCPACLCRASGSPGSGRGKIGFNSSGSKDGFNGLREAGCQSQRSPSKQTTLLQQNHRGPSKPQNLLMHTTGNS